MVGRDLDRGVMSHAVFVEVNTSSQSHSPVAVAGGPRAGVGDERNEAEPHVRASGQQQCAASLRHGDGAEVAAGTCGGPSRASSP